MFSLNVPYLISTAILRDALLRGGLNQTTLDLLITGADTQQEQEDSSWDQTTFARPTPVSVSITKPSDYKASPDPVETFGNGTTNGFLQSHDPYRRSYSFGAVESMASYNDKDDGFVQDDSDIKGINGNWRDGARPGPNDKRTILFTNLPERTTHAELTSKVKGGILLDIYVRNDRTATVSFVSGAEAFLNYAKRQDIYIRTKYIGVQWNDRQFHMPNHVANKIAAGASRNIVVRGGAHRGMNEQGIRDDLEHIHNLVVISVKVNNKSGDIFISTNSVHNALFARTCMMSRALYKGLKIEYYPDECNVPVPKLPPPRDPPRPAQTWARKPSYTSMVSQVQANNMYAVLGEDGAADSSEATDSSDDDSVVTDHEQAQPGYQLNGAKINWADSIAVV